jgi:hypothetical protein
MAHHCMSGIYMAAVASASQCTHTRPNKTDTTSKSMVHSALNQSSWPMHGYTQWGLHQPTATTTQTHTHRSHTNKAAHIHNVQPALTHPSPKAATSLISACGAHSLLLSLLCSQCQHPHARYTLPLCTTPSRTGTSSCTPGPQPAASVAPVALTTSVTAPATSPATVSAV